LTQGPPDNPARPAPGVLLCAVEELSDPGAKGFRFRAESKMFAGFVVRKGGALTAYVDSCPHAGWPLAAFDDRYLTREPALILCAGHGALFRIEDGACVAGPCMGEHLQPWPIQVRDGNIFTA
jgi:nitrite reductase/ring-hydroxylating ferredoxin subunit